MIVMKIIKLKIILYIIILVFLEGCSQRIFVSIPKENAFIGCSCSNLSFCIPIDTKDTALVNKRAYIGVFTVKDIELQKGVYKIEVKCDSLYKDGSERWVEIYSVKSEKIKGLKKIKKGYKYEMVLNPYFLHDVGVDFSFRKVYLNGKPYGISTGRMNIYTTFNLKGLYYIPLEDNVSN